MLPMLPQMPMGTMEPWLDLTTLWLRKLFMPELGFFDGWCELLEIRVR